ncbi:MAG TPA: 23S rRNA (uracil(1939)-C(5))-methyltransferase RlmD [Steroidobacteraceae bacterium]|nr:23S rRNA (uracil(1939)-C(5))-methyltransferase RlmD [Steroidobacteraceae bacterium]
MRGAEEAEVVDLAHDGRGVARLGGKAVFVAGALPGERVLVRRTRQRARHEEALLLEVLAPSAERVAPACRHYGRCGGCALQHLDPAAQLAAKQRELMSQLERIGRLRPERMLAPLGGPPYGYRRRARLGVRVLPHSGRAIVGFRERTSPRLADVRDCPVLAAPAGALCEPLGELVGLLSIAARVPQIEIAVGERATVLVLRVLAAPSAGDLERLRAFGAAHGVEFWLQPGGAESAAPIDPPGAVLDYALAEFGLTLEFGPLDFVQVNAELNRRMVGQAVALLEPAADEAVLDLYCGLGNFTLPLARRAGRVLGVEGDAALVGRARRNAERNGIGNARFALADLAGDLRAEPWARERFDLVLLDPPRAGAQEALPLIGASGARRVVYISCHPASLARDAGLLVREHGFRLLAAGVMDMFPHTAHVESLAVFEPST